MTTKKTLSVKISDERRSELALEVAQHVTRYDELEAEKKAIGSELSAKMKDQRAAISSKAKALVTGVIDELVEVEEVHDFDQNRIRTRRMDTGEFIGERPMTGDERQIAIDFDEDGVVTPAAPEVAADKTAKKVRASLKVVPSVDEGNTH